MRTRSRSHQRVSRAVPTDPIAASGRDTSLTGGAEQVKVCATRSLTKVDELQRQVHVASADRLDGGLQVVALLARYTDLVAHDLRLYLQLRVLDELDDLARAIRVDSLFQSDFLFGAATGPGLDVAGFRGLQPR